jgi:hypothetical protein
MVAHAYNISMQENVRGRRDHEFEVASLGYIVRPCLDPLQIKKREK